MKIPYAIFALVVGLITAVQTPTRAQGIKFENSNWEQVKSKAKSSKKLIFVDFYATWCGPCKYMSKTIFTKSEVAEVFNSNFICYKVNAELEEQALVESVELEAYPTLVFFSSEGKVMFKHVGSLDDVELISLADNILAYGKNRALLDEGKATPEQHLSYLHIAKNVDPVGYATRAKEYLEKVTVDDLVFRDVWNFVISEVRDVNHPLFKDIIKDGKALFTMHESSYWNYVSEVLGAQIENLAVLRTRDGLDIVKNYMHTIFTTVFMQETDVKFIELLVDSDYYLKVNDVENYQTSVTTFVDNYYKDDIDNLMKYSLQLSSATSDLTYKEKALAWAQRAHELAKSKMSLFNLAEVYSNIGQKGKAIASAEGLYTFPLDDSEKEFVTDYLAKLKL